MSKFLDKIMQFFVEKLFIITLTFAFLILTEFLYSSGGLITKTINLLYDLLDSTKKLLNFKATSTKYESIDVTTDYTAVYNSIRNISIYCFIVCLIIYYFRNTQ